MWNKAWSYLSLYGAHGLKVFSFILLIPHFTSIFPKDSWGQILTVQALALWFQIVVEYGFNLSATRSMSRVRDDLQALARLVSGVAGAKIFLSGLVVILAFGSATSLTNLHGLGKLIAWSTVFAIAQGFNPVWYFLARGRFGQYATIDFVSRLIYLILCYYLITRPSQGALIFIFGVLTACFSNFAGYLLIARQTPLRFPTVQDSRLALREGFSMFLFVGVTSIYTTLNIVILGFSQTTGTVAAYGTSDRIVRAAGGLLEPLNRVIYAKLSHLYHHDFPAALAFLRKAAVILILAGLAIFGIGEWLTPYIVQILAPTYTDAVGYLRLLLLFIPLLAINNIVGLHIMLPLGMDRAFNGVFLVVSMISVAAMLVLTPIYGSVGMGVITILTEALACIGMIYMVWRSRKLLQTHLGGSYSAQSNSDIQA
ncbi:hypothetical protein EHF33_04385 [Deinococcus psychrotolerans]|uniref:Uncharacterized protein n=1 Tax=Deinococcus psychrotolerans TaxID=2489213 RepID=A0A3G8Y9N9_9DEIO|nr:oligosaccharide flippase family protein [Deinococcus psychrotolerans]AZI42078.1 hypothetical protein EHF33_04385 [Deinococcus psychrotolerans]